MSFPAFASFFVPSSKASAGDYTIQPRDIDGNTTGAAISTGLTSLFTWRGSVPDNTATVDLVSASLGVIDTQSVAPSLTPASIVSAINADSTQQALQDHAAQAAAGAGTGDGDTDVNENTGGTDNLRYETGGTGIGQASILAYLKSDYDGGNRTIRGTTTTKDDGRWLRSMRLNAGLAYTFRFEKSGQYGPDFKDATP